MASDEPVALSATRLFVAYAVVSLLVVVAIGLALVASYQSQADRRGLAEGRSEARLLAQAAIEPIIRGRDLSTGVDDPTHLQLTRTAALLIDRDAVLRLRLRNLAGKVVFSNDGTGLSGPIEDEVLAAAAGHVQVLLTRINSDSNDEGGPGAQVVEVYLPVRGGLDASWSGVLELYLPYAPIAADIGAGMHVIYLDLAAGLAALYLVLLGLSVGTTRRLRRHAARNAYLAEHDLLTGLPNRRVFFRRIGEALATPAGPTTVIAVIDLDRFKEVNDSLGHVNGDALLSRLSERLVDSTSAADTVAHLGGDEFGVILCDVGSGTAAEELLRRLRTRIAEPVQLDGLALIMDSSVGFAVLGADGDDPETLIQRADAAMYLAKHGHTGVVRYDRADDRYDPDRLAIVSELRRAISTGELVLHYQPKVRLGDDSVTAVEALIRWRHPRRGLLYPDAFLPVAEQTDLIDPLTNWVVETALVQLTTWGEAAAGLSMSVNVSARNLGDPRFADRILHLVQDAGLSPDRLVLEITETAVFSDVDRAVTVLTRLAASGVRISLDDFGQGQTSLSFLSRLPLAELKIDKAFVTDIVADKAHDAIVRSLVELAHNLGFSVVAEGVEDTATHEALRDMGCDEVQGYLLARPMDSEHFAAWLAQRRIRKDQPTLT